VIGRRKRTVVLCVNTGLRSIWHRRENKRLRDDQPKAIRGVKSNKTLGNEFSLDQKSYAPGSPNCRDGPVSIRMDTRRIQSREYNVIIAGIII